jgi:hypothetical protein
MVSRYRSIYPWALQTDSCLKKITVQAINNDIVFFVVKRKNLCLWIYGCSAYAGEQAVGESLVDCQGGVSDARAILQGQGFVSLAHQRFVLFRFLLFHSCIGCLQDDLKQANINCSKKRKIKMHTLKEY